MSTTSPILSAKLSLDSDVPLYNQLVAIIKRHISAGILVPAEAAGLAGALSEHAAAAHRAAAVSAACFVYSASAAGSEGLSRSWSVLHNNLPTFPYHSKLYQDHFIT